MYIALVNADRDRDRNIALQIEGTDVAGNKMTIQKLETDSITAANTPEEPTAVQVTEDAEVELEGNPIINLKKHSFVIVRIVKAVEPEADKSELQAAVDAEYGKVDAAIAEAEKLNKKDYKDFSKVEEAIAAVVRGKKIDEQTEVDAMAQRIEDAIAALEKADVPGKPEKPEKPGKPEQPGNLEKPGTPEKPNGNKVPVTGDETTPILWMTLVVMAGTIIRVGKKRLNIIRKNR